MRGLNSAKSGGAEPAAITSVAVAAHELKSPLVLLRQLALDVSSEQLSSEQQRHVMEQMVLVSEKALRLTTDITKSEALQASLFHLEPVNPLSVCEDVTDELSRLYSLYDRALSIKRTHSLPPVVANRDLLRRILLNFADNALHYSDEQGVVELHIQLLRQKQSVRIGVRDHGPYLPNSRWRQLISSLERTQTVHARPQSSGLGLFIAHRFAEAMNGRIGAIRHNDGASFYVELPVSRQLSLL